MADKFIIHGAAFNGDGTSSAQATVDGGPGAWNNINILTGTVPAFGSIAAGDTIYIRSKSAADADITITLPAANVYLGSAAATTAAPVAWVIDNGAVWPGIDGTIKHTISAGNYIFQVIANNAIVAKRRGAFVYESTSTAIGSSRGVELAGAIIDGWRVICSSVDTGGYAEPGVRTAVNSFGSQAIRCDITMPGFAEVGLAVQSSKLLMLDCDIELTSSAAYTANRSVFVAKESASSAASGMLEAIGCTIRGIGAHSGKRVAGGFVKVIGGSVPSIMQWAMPQATAHVLPPIGIGVDGALGSIGRINHAGVIDSRQDGYYPTLNGVLPDSASTPWSWKLYPDNIAGYGSPTDVVLSAFSTTASTLTTATVEFLVPTTFALDRRLCWVDITWTDSSGIRRSASTFDPAGSALDPSTAAWSAVTYGATAFDKRKATFTLTGGVKQNTMVVARLCVAKKAASTNDVLFVCPAVVLA